MQALANKSLVRLESMGDDRRAAMLETVRDFVLHRLLEADEEQATQRGRLAWCIARAEQAAPLLHSATRRAGCSDWSLIATTSTRRSALRSTPAP